MSSVEVVGEAAMQQLGGRLVEQCGGGGVIFLKGDLGAGKTTLVRGMLRHLGYEGAVRSPTYTLLEPYTIDGRQLIHLDLYRLADPEELEFLGLRDLLEADSLVVVEWPQQGVGFLPEVDLLIEIDHLDGGRRLHFEPRSERGEAMVAGLL